MGIILAADIGGTSSRFGFFESDASGGLSLRKSLWLRTGEANSFGHLLATLRVADFPITPEAAEITVIAIAGPVIDGVRSSPPFISWSIDLSRAAEEFSFRRSLLINDFIAQAYATRSLPGATARPITQSRTVKDGVVAVVGAGTGLGQAALVPDGQGGYLAVASEGGHAEFPLVGTEEIAFGESLCRDLGVARLMSNMVVSGAGLSNIHWYFTGKRLRPEEMPAELSSDSQTLSWAARFYGRVCKLFVLQTASFGGLYVTGGVAARTPALLTHPEFEKEFRSSNTMGELLRSMPVSVMTDQESGLWGAAFLGEQVLAKMLRMSQPHRMFPSD